MLTIGLTGTSGSGKGYLYQYLFGEDVAFCDTDSLYHSMISRPGECVDALKKEFGDVVVNNRGGIDRNALASIVFNDTEKLEALNRITHTLILERIRQAVFMAQLQNIKYFYVDAPLLFESGFDKECDFTVGVTAPLEIRVKRVMERDGITLKKALERFKNQKDDSFFRENCDFTVINDGRELEPQIDKLKTVLKRLYDEKK
ncbi:MAG: dephospho-CoA kinase [Ruminococcaceae bacterium]|nr:dephospho-CoA kinase [Oscillospiraceae bacterium]